MWVGLSDTMRSGTAIASLVSGATSVAGVVDGVVVSVSASTGAESAGADAESSSLPHAAANKVNPARSAISARGVRVFIGASKELEVKLGPGRRCLRRAVPCLEG